MNLTQTDAVRLGFDLQLSSGFENETMIAIVDKLVNANPANSTLRNLQSVLHTLPNNTDGFSRTAAYITMVFIAVIMVSLRIYLRLRVIVGKLKADDKMAIAAIISVSIAGAVFTLQAIDSMHGGKFGVRHIWDLPLYKIRWSIRDLMFIELSFVIAHLFVKSVFLTFYWTLTPSRHQRYAIAIVAVYTIAITIISLCFALFQCTPIDEWNHFGEPKTKCFDRLAAFSANGIFYIVADFFIFLLPIPAIWQLRGLSLREKLSLSAMFASGAFIVATSVVRLKMLRVWLDSVDRTYAFIYQGPWAVCELALSIIISCLPVIYKGIVTLRAKRRRNSTIAAFGSSIGARSRSELPAQQPRTVTSRIRAQFFRSKFAGDSILSTTIMMATRAGAEDGGSNPNGLKHNIDSIEEEPPRVVVEDVEMIGSTSKQPETDITELQST